MLLSQFNTSMQESGICVWSCVPHLLSFYWTSVAEASDVLRDILVFMLALPKEGIVIFSFNLIGQSTNLQIGRPKENYTDVSSAATVVIRGERTEIQSILLSQNAEVNLKHLVFEVHGSQSTNAQCEYCHHKPFLIGNVFLYCPINRLP